jgi:hypothetical protein
MNTLKRQGKRKSLGWGKGFGVFLLVLLCAALAGHLIAQSKKLQVAVEEANLYLDRTPRWSLWCCREEPS